MRLPVGRVWVERVAAVLALLGGCILLLVALLTVISVLGRWLLDRPVTGDVELVQLGVAVAIVLALPYCQWHGTHVIVDVFTARAGHAARGSLDRAARWAAAVVFSLLAWRAGAGVIDLAAAGETTMVLGIPLWLGYLLMPFALALAALAALFTTERRAP